MHFHRDKLFSWNWVTLIFNTGFRCCYAASAYNKCIEYIGKNCVLSNDYDSLSRHQRYSILSESSPNYINQKNRSYGRFYRKSRSSSSRSRSRSPTNMQGSPGIQESPGLDLQTECQNQEGLDLNLPETYHIDCWSQGDQGVQRLDQHFNPPEINQPIPEIRQHLMTASRLLVLCLYKLLAFAWIYCLCDQRTTFTKTSLSHDQFSWKWELKDYSSFSSKLFPIAKNTQNNMKIVLT